MLIYGGKKLEEWFPVEECRQGLTEMGREGIFWAMALLYILLGVWVSQVCTFVKTQSGTLKICAFHVI